jgi:hypothetical protein
MTTRMFHPEHGWTHAYGDAEVAAHEARGWQVEKLTIPGERAVPLRDALIRPLSLHEGRDEMTPRRKPGRPPKAK